MPGAKLVAQEQEFEDTSWVKRLVKIIEEFRKVNPDITANQMLVLLRIGERPGVTQKELADLTNMKDGTISRICALMSNRGHQQREGLDVIAIKDVPTDYRAKGQYLVKDGKKMFASVKRLMTDPAEE